MKNSERSLLQINYIYYFLTLCYLLHHINFTFVVSLILTNTPYLSKSQLICFSVRPQLLNNRSARTDLNQLHIDLQKSTTNPSSQATGELMVAWKDIALFIVAEGCWCQRYK